VSAAVARGVESLRDLAVIWLVVFGGILAIIAIVAIIRLK
jgi:hypothetical protein